MPDISPRLGIPLPLGTENVSRADYRAALSQIDTAAETPAAAQAKVDLAVINLKRKLVKGVRF